MEREQTTLRLVPEVMDKLRNMAEERGISLNDVITILLEQALEQESLRS